MIIAICALLVLVTLIGMIYPLVKPMVPKEAENIELGDNLSEVDSSKLFLLELEFDYLMGNTSEDVYRELESKYNEQPCMHINLVE